MEPKPVFKSSTVLTAHMNNSSTRRSAKTVTVDRTITLPAGCDQMLVRLQLDATTVGAIGMMSEILIERADAYATAVGGGLPGFFTGDTMPLD